MRVLKHPNIVGFKEVYKTRKGDLNIVMDYIEGGDLSEIIATQKKLMKESGGDEYFSEDLILTWFT